MKLILISLFGALGTVSKPAIEEGIKDRFLKKYTASGGTATLDSVIEKKFKKKMLSDRHCIWSVFHPKVHLV